MKRQLTVRRVGRSQYVLCLMDGVNPVWRRNYTNMRSVLDAIWFQGEEAKETGHVASVMVLSPSHGLQQSTGLVTACARLNVKMASASPEKQRSTS